MRACFAAGAGAAPPRCARPARLRLARAYLVGGDDADAHGSAAAGASYDFGDAARMAAEFVAGQRAR